MALYGLFTLACAMLGLIYLNRGQGSARLYPSIAAVGTFSLFMAVISLDLGYSLDAAFTAGAASILCGTVSYWLALLVQWLWGRGAGGKTAALLLCIVGFQLSVPVYLIGTAVHRLFRRQFDEADAAAAQARQEREERRAAAKQRKTDAEEEILQRVHTDEELCTYFAELYRDMGCAPVVERAGENGPLRMFLEINGMSYSFVAICRQELLGPEAVEWAAGFRGSAQRAGLVTTGTFTRRAVTAAGRLNVALVDRPNLPKIQRAARRAAQRRAFGIGPPKGGKGSENG